MEYDKVLLFRDFRNRYPNDVPERFNNLIPGDAKIYITGYGVKEMLNFMRREEKNMSEVEKKHEIAFAVADLLNGLIPRDYFDFSFVMEVRRMMSLLKRVNRIERKKQITTFIEAREENCLNAYFGDNDWLNICKDHEKKNFDYVYSDDYDVFLRSYSKLELAEFYMRWMREHNATIDIKYQDYSNPLNFVDYFFRQVGQYIDIIRNNRDRRYYIVGDGPGTASIACLMLGVSYFSMEPNDIGRKARDLGIITSDKLEDVLENDIVFLANVGDYVDYSCYDEYDKIIVDFSGVEQNLKHRSYGGRGSVYSSMEINLTSFPRRSRCLGLLKDRKVFPTTPLAKQMCIENGVDVYADGEGVYRVTTDEKEDEMNMLSMELPSDLRARKGHIKKYKGVFFQFFDMAQRVIYKDGFAEYFPKSYTSVRYVRNFFLDGDIVHVQSPRPEKVRGVYKDDGRIMKLFYLHSYEIKGVTYGKYKALDLKFAPKD